MKTWSALLLVATFIAFVPLAVAADDPVIARVNGIDIKQSELDFAARCRCGVPGVASWPNRAV
jgi:peptidyl-prolyl cis-trans isomerase C